MFKIENKESNYLAKIVKLGNPVQHPNAHSLQGFIIDFNRVWTDMSYKEGDIVVYFPLECQLNPELLSYLNLYSHSELNQDKTKKGYFADSGRVKAIKLRGEPSEGIVLPIGAVMDACMNNNEETNWSPLPEHEDFLINMQFDTISIIGKDTWVCKKYVPSNVRTQGEPNQERSKNKVKITSLIVDGQFHLHRSTPKLKDNIHQIKPDDIISLTYKLHGTSAVFSNVLLKRQLNWVEKLLLRFGVKIQTEKYGNVYSSRSVIKDVDGIVQHRGHFYNVDIWGIVNEELKDKILKGITLYGEIAGYLPSGRSIQSKYDYGCSTGQHQFYVYRITQTNLDGHVTEFNWQMVKDYCTKHGLVHVPELYYGTAQLYCPLTIGEDNDVWQVKCMEQLTEDYLEKDCHMCKNKVPAEGVVVRVEKEDCKAFKLKSFKFFEHESKELDKGETNLEEEN